MSNQHDKCRLSFASATQRPARILRDHTRSQQKIFQAYAGRGEKKFSSCPPDNSSSRLVAAQTVAELHQERLNFLLQESDDICGQAREEPRDPAMATLPLYGSVESLLVDPLFQDVDTKVKNHQEAPVDTELEETPVEDLDTWLLSPLLVVNEKLQEPPKTTESHPEAPGMRYKHRPLKCCEFPDCDFKILPKLAKYHYEIFHPTKVEGEAKPKIPKKVSPPFLVCPYCGKVYRLRTMRNHVSSKFDEIKAFR